MSEQRLCIHDYRMRPVGSQFYGTLQYRLQIRRWGLWWKIADYDDYFDCHQDLQRARIGGFEPPDTSALTSHKGDTP